MKESQPTNDTLPERYFQNKTDGPLATKPIVDRATMDKAKKWYYYFMGWDENGIPTPEKLAELEIEQPVYPDIEARTVYK